MLLAKVLHNVIFFRYVNIEQ